jgi:hypothetical protein
MNTKNEDAYSANKNATVENEDKISSYEEKIARLEAELKQSREREANSIRNSGGGLDDSIATAPDTVLQVVDGLGKVMEIIHESSLNNLHMNTASRMRLLGAGERRWGLIEKTADIAADNEQYFSSPISSLAGLRKLITNVELWRGRQYRRTGITHRPRPLSDDFQCGIRHGAHLLPQRAGGCAGGRRGCAGSVWRTLSSRL